jgi:hypothetical protein
LLLIVFLVVASLVPLFVNRSASALPAPKLVYIYSTGVLSDKGLDFCSDSSTKGCLFSLEIDGNQVNETQNPAEADYLLAGGVYERYCRFPDTPATSCEVPYLRLSALKPAASLVSATIGFRRLLDDRPTSRIAVVITNGNVVSFAGATSETADVSLLSIETNVIEDGATKVGGDIPDCIGFQSAIENCEPKNIGTSTSTKRMDILYLPGHTSPGVPADQPRGCTGPEDPSHCYVLVFDRTGVGSWVDTNAMFFGPTEASRGTGAVEFRVGGPHFRTGTDPAAPTDGDLNIGRLRQFVSSDFLMSAFGLSPEEADASTLPVRRLTGDLVSTPDTTYTPVDGGLLVETTGFTFSVPRISTSRVVTATVGSSLSASALITSAGLSSVQDFYRSSINVNSRSGIRRRGSTYTFNRTGTFEISIRYKSSKRARLSTRTLTVTVTP